MKQLFLLLFLLPLSVCAQSKINCGKAETQEELNYCAKRNFMRVDSELTAVQQQILKRLSQKQRENLKDAQKKWTAYRDAHCKMWANDFEGKTMHDMVFYDCLEETTSARIEELQEFSDNLER